jgi:hypothetical protein
MDDRIKQLLTKMTTKRMEDANVRGAEDAKRVRAEYAARGTHDSGFAKVAFVEAIINGFGEAMHGAVADYVGIADDTAASADDIQEFQFEYDRWLDQVHQGLLRRVEHELERDPQLRPELVQSVERVVGIARRDADIRFGRERLRRERTSRGSRPMGAADRGQIEHRDVFVSHAGPDRGTFVNALVGELQRRGLSVWYSESEITLGDSLRARIDDGLAFSRFGVVVVSPAFFAREWTKTELDSLAARANREGRKVILPVWHEMTLDQVGARSPMLAAVAGISSAQGVEAVADALVRAVDADRIGQA